MTSVRLRTELFGARFQNPVLLAAGTCGFGKEMVGVLDLESLGGFVTKSVTLKPREGNPAPRVAEAGPGMVNSVGLANPGLRRVKAEKLPWIRENVRRPRVFVSVAGHTVEEFEELVGELDDEDGFLGFELNLSCPNDARLGGAPFAADAGLTAEVVGRARARTGRPLLAKLAPNVPDPGAVAGAAEDGGADGLTLVNTLPALALSPTSGRPLLGAGSGGLSGPPLKAVGVETVVRVRESTSLPLVGVGGILSADDALEYLRAGASLVQVGTASFADPRAALRVVEGLGKRCESLGVGTVEELVGARAAMAPSSDERAGRDERRHA